MNCKCFVCFIVLHITILLYVVDLLSQKKLKIKNLKIVLICCFEISGLIEMFDFGNIYTNTPTSKSPNSMSFIYFYNWNTIKKFKYKILSKSYQAP